MSRQRHRFSVPQVPGRLILIASAICGGVLLFVAPCLLAANDPPAESVPTLAEQPAESDAGESGRIKLKRPGPREFIVDLADLISSPDEQRIREIATKLLDDKATPIIVVTIESMAKQVFFDSRVHHTTGRTGLLIYVSLFERMAAIAADEAVVAQLGQPVLDELRDHLTASLRSQPLAEAISHTIEAAGSRLAAVLPRAEGDVNELPDALVVLERRL